MIAPFSPTPPRWLIPLLGSLVAFGPLSIDMYLPALPTIAQQLNSTQGEIQLSLGSFLLGFCIGMLLYGPLSDRIGRRRLLINGLILYVITSLLCALASNIWLFIVLRFVQAFGSGAAVVMGRAIARDIFPNSDLPRVLSLMTLVTMVAPLLAPSLGGLLLLLFSWRAIFLFLGMIGLMILLLFYRYMPETLPRQQAASSILQAFANYALLLRNGTTMALIGTLSFTFAGVFTFISGSPFVYINYFGVPAKWYGLLFSINVIGMILLIIINVNLLKKISQLRILIWQTAAQLLFSLLLLSGYNQPLLLFIPLIVLFISITSVISANCLSLLLQDHGNQAGSINALAISCQFAIAAIANLIVSSFQSASPLPMVTMMAGCGALSWLSTQVMLHLRHKQHRLIH